MMELPEQQRQEWIVALEDYDPEEGIRYINEVMAEEDAKDPYLESYQHYGEQA